MPARYMPVRLYFVCERAEADFAPDVEVILSSVVAFHGHSMVH